MPKKIERLDPLLDYNTHDPKGWCGDPSRGAALGRPMIVDKPADFEGKIYVREVRLNAGGYDRNGTYFGHYMCLYWACTADNEIDFCVRAVDRPGAVAAVRKHYAKAKFRA